MREFAQWLQASALSETIQSTSWLIPLLQSIHIVMIGVVFVSSLMIALRVLGRMRADEPFADVWNRFAPWMWSGLGIMAVTGLILVVGEPVREFTAISFWVKMTLIVIGVASTVALGRTLRPVTLAAAQPFPAAARSAALGLIVLWLAIIFFGRAIAYDVEVWGKLAQ